MSVELQTGTECLVSDASDAELYAGIQGAGNYILRKPLELSMIDSNTLSVGAGTGLQNGRHIRFKGTTEFSIPSGVQAQKRSNIAVVRTTISRDESTMKTLTHSEPIVLSGEPVAEGDPGDPAWIEGDLLAGDTVADFPIARVVTDGINVGEPEPLFDVLQSAKDRWDSQSQKQSIQLEVTGDVLLDSTHPWSTIRKEVEIPEGYRYGGLLGFAIPANAIIRQCYAWEYPDDHRCAVEMDLSSLGGAAVNATATVWVNLIPISREYL